MSDNSSTVYETWVRALRSWRDDPLSDLSQLPKLTEASFPPATYNRLINHLNDAINRFMSNWNDRLLEAVKAAREHHDLARALVAARAGLEDRLVLARHPSLPESIRQQLLNQAESDIKSLQQQLEDGAEHAAKSGSSVGREQREATLRLYRDNALTAVLDPNFSVEGSDDPGILVGRLVSPVEAQTASTALPLTTRRVRQVFVPPTEES